METKLREYIEKLFEDAPRTKAVVEMKEELLQNVIERYNDLINEGRTPDAAFNIAVASIGDVSELIERLRAEADRKVVSQEEIEKQKRKSALLISIAVALYIICIVPIIWLQNEIGVILMFVIAAVATGLIIFNSMTKKRTVGGSDDILGEFREWKATDKDAKKKREAINSIIWTLITVIYFLVSFLTGQWGITWIIFLIGVAVTQIVEAVTTLKK